LSHFGLYGILGGLSAFFYKEKKIFFLFLNLLLFACFTELSQFFTLTRVPGLGEWRLNLFGALTGLGCVRLFLKKSQKAS